MTDNEKTGSNLNSEQKEEIAETAQVLKSDVEDVVQKYKQLAHFHSWLHLRKDKGEPMPETREELMHIYKVERPKFLMPKVHKKSHSRAMNKYACRRHYT